jgi:uncharacterized phage protein (TIGR02220 family)
MKELPKNYKWTWTIDQRAILESGLNIDVIDFSILRMLMDFATCEACKKMHQEGIVFYMFSWKLVKDQMPILNLNTRQSVKKRFAKLIVAKLICPHPDNKRTRTPWFRFDENKDLLFSKHCKPKLTTSNESLQPPSNESLQHCKPKLSVTSNESLQPTSNESLQDTTNNINTNTINKENNTNQSKIGEGEKQNVSLNSKIKQLEEQNKELAKRLTKQSVKQLKTEEPTTKKKKGLPYLEEYQKVVGMINHVCQRKLVIYTDTIAIQQDEKYKAIIARLRKGATVEQMEAVTRLKNKQWRNDNRMMKFRRPSTLFGGHWAKYMDELSEQSTDTPIKDTYEKLDTYIKENNLTVDDIVDMSNGLGKYAKTQP